MMKNILLFALLCIGLLILTACDSNGKSSKLTKREKISIQDAIQNEINIMIQAVNNKDIDTYMAKMPLDFIIYNEKGEEITCEMQRAHALRDWSIIERTLNNEMMVDSIEFSTSDSVYVFTSQRWERLMYQRDGTTIDTVITTQLHKELWKNKSNGWVGYDVEELGGEIFINGEKYNQN